MNDCLPLSEALPNRSNLWVENDGLLLEHGAVTATFFGNGNLLISMQGATIYKGPHQWDADILQRFAKNTVNARKRLLTHLLSLQNHDCHLITDSYIVTSTKASFKKGFHAIAALMKYMAIREHNNKGLYVTTATNTHGAAVRPNGEILPEYLTLARAIVDWMKPWGIHSKGINYSAPVPYTIHITGDDLPTRVAMLSLPLLVNMCSRCNISPERLRLTDELHQ
jgi:hypothetical protein